MKTEKLRYGFKIFIPDSADPASLLFKAIEEAVDLGVRADQWLAAIEKVSSSLHERPGGGKVLAVDLVLKHELTEDIPQHPREFSFPLAASLLQH